jgi:hypothetical protein
VVQGKYAVEFYLTYGLPSPVHIPSLSPLSILVRTFPCLISPLEPTTYIETGNVPLTLEIPLNFNE